MNSKHPSFLPLLFLLCFSTAATAQVDTGFYYRLTTQWQGDGKSLDVINDGKNNNQLQLATTGNYSGQYWKFTPIGNGYYRLTNQWQGALKSLDILNDGKNNSPILANTGSYSGQNWKVTTLGNGYYRFTTMWQGDGKSLDVINDGKNNRLQLANTGLYSGQFWKLTRMHAVVEDPGFYMIFASDPQWPWTNKTDDEITQTESEKESDATTLNQNHVKSMNTLISELNLVKGIILNGDLTAYGHSPEFDKYTSIYKGANATIYAGLGNHDYANNIDDTYENNSANRMVEYMVDHIKSNGSTRSDYKKSDSYTFPDVVTTITGSLAYSWDIGNVHFVQLQNYPLYKREWSNYVSIGAAKRKTVKITSSLSWLKTDLALARQAGKIIILNYHDSDEHWGDYYTTDELTTLTADFKAILDTYKVSAVFVGHYHKWLGKQTSPRRATATYGTTPVFYCGSASQSKYLLANFKGNKLIVENVSSLDGAATRSNKTEITVFDQPIAVATPQADGWVTFFNQSGYVAKYTLTYTLNGELKTFTTGNMNLGNKQRYEIPAAATGIKVKGEGKTGLAWEVWRTTFSESFNTPPAKCFKSYGTSLDQKWNNNCE
ncbi:RICIN domain-containing protein [Foetidibacter luteolus]|uniref:RICIN domain-containing protein n=1 Tax=Foetidibacter luteolus TaxID=2608880 RepID=UPI00129AD869|nr:RICIN domain-containing protein [Foetidibacter luteolus]